VSETWDPGASGAGFEVVDRCRMEHDGKTGSRLERVTTADGRVFVVKTEEPQTNWLMQATGDDGRLVRLWASGTLARLPPEIDCAIEIVEPTLTGWRVVMRDVSAALIPDGTVLTRGQSLRLLRAISSLHDALAGVAVDGLCPLLDRFTFLSPATARQVPAHLLRDPILTGWERFGDLVPDDVGQAVLKLLDRPEPLASALAAYPASLLHGDLKVANLGFAGDRVVVLDWGSVTGLGPRATDHAWYVAINGAAVAATLDELVADIAALLGPDDRAALPLALLGALVQLGWEKALGATSDDPSIKAREEDGLRWWRARAADALDQWSPA
jgi:hypothetical protein